MQEIAERKHIIPATPPQPAASQSATAIQLGLSHLIAGALALCTYLWLTQLRVPQPYPLLSALAAACASGLLCTLNLQYNLYLLELTLAQFAHGLSITSSNDDDYKKLFTRRWPLGPLFMHLEEATQRMQHYAENAQLTTDLREKTLQQASESAAQAERNRIARDLHDSIKQQIFSISVSAAAARAHWQGENVDEARAMVEDIQNSAKEAQVEMQALLQQLRPAPLENTNLRDALYVQAQALGFRTGAQVHIEMGDLPGHDRLLPGTQATIFRLVQEAFANIARHARAHSIWLILRTEERALHIEVRDDGQGFEMGRAPKGMGLNNLRERTRELHGTIEISSQPGQGTTVTISIPLLEALSNPAEEERQKYELARARELAQRGYQICENTSLLMIFLVALSIPLNIHWSVIALSLLLMVYGYISGVYYRTQVALNAGLESRAALELAQRQHTVNQNLMRMLSLCLWYSFTLTGFLRSGGGWWMLFGLIAGMAGFTQFARQRHYRNTERYYNLLSIQELRWELEQRRQRQTRLLMLWLLGISAGLILAHSKFILPPETPAQWMVYGLVLIVLFIGVGLFFDYLQSQRWKQILGQREQNAYPEEA